MLPSSPRHPSPASRPRPGMLLSPRSELKVETESTADGAPPVKEVIHSPPSHINSNSNSNQMAPLARRAFLLKQRHAGVHSGNHTLDGTLTTTGLTATTASRTSPDRKSGTYFSHSEMAQRILQHSAQVAEAASSMLDGSLKQSNP